MGAFHDFQIVQMVPNRAKYHIFLILTTDDSIVADTAIYITIPVGLLCI